MDIERAHLLLKSLADGVDPITGWVLATDHPCQQPDIIRALFLATGFLEREARRERRFADARQGLPVNTGKSWTVAEEAVLLKSYSAGKSIEELAELHRRTENSIRARLEKLGQLPVLSHVRRDARPGTQ